MTDIKRVGSLELDQDLDFERRSWRAQRIGWMVMAAILLAALLGVFGSGPVAEATGGSGGPLEVQYKRFWRLTAPEGFELHLAPGVSKDGEIRIVFQGDFTRQIQIQRIQPEPESADLTAEGAVFTFKVAQPEQPSVIALYVVPQELGPMTTRIGLEGTEGVTLTQFVYP